MDKSSILKAFNNHIIEMIDDLISIYPKNSELLTTKTFVERLKKMNPKSMIKLWYSSVVVKYKTQIMNSDENFFMNKDIDESELGEYNNDKVKNFLKTMQKEIGKASESNKKKCFKYLQNLIKLSEIYFN
jgi:glutamyl-tRNA reductase